MTIIHYRRFILFLFFLCCSAPAYAQSLPDFTALVRSNSAAVVNISSTSKKADSESSGRMQIPDGPEDSPLYDLLRKFLREQMPESPIPPRKTASLGSGFIISDDGYVITNSHVVSDADEIFVKLNDRREFSAEIIGADKRSDIAVLKIDGSDLPVIKLGSSANLKVGEWVLAIGSPFGFDYTVTQGIISGIGRSLPNENYVPFIQTDVAINPGNSGGPLFNLKGEVIGVNSMIYSRTGNFMGLSFAVPVDVVVDVYSQLRERGYVTRGWLGVLIQDVNRELAESFGMDKPHGALVAKVLDDSPAEDAGLEVGDIIVTYEGTEVTFSTDLPPLVGASKVDTKASLEIIREGRRKRLKALIAELPEEERLAQADGFRSPEALANDMNVTVRELSAAQRKRLELPEDGVLVDLVMDGPGSRAGIRRGDVILRINNVRIGSVSQFEKALADMPRNRPVPILVQRRGSPTFLALQIADDDSG